MKIVLLAPANVIHTRRWFYALCALGHEVLLVSQHRHDLLDLPANGAVHYLPHTGIKGYFLNTVALARVLNSFRPDVVNTHYASGYGMLSSLVHYRPNVLSVWGSDVYDFPYEARPLKMWLIRWILGRADRVASTSEVMAVQVRRLLASVENIAITPFGVDTNLFLPVSKFRDQALITVGTVKTLERKYGIDTTIRAFARLWNDEEIIAKGLRDRLRLLLVGDGSERASLVALAQQLGVHECTTFAGAVEHSDVPKWLNTLDIYVAASRYDSESFGVAVIEALSCELPVVVSDKGGLPEVVEQNYTGFVVPADDVPGFSRALKILVLDEDLRHQMGKMGRESVIKKYEWRSCIESMVECYRQAIDGL